MRSCEILVIGSGPGGATTAWELIKNKRDVVLIESGDFYPLESCTPFTTKEMEQKYKYGGLNPTISNPKISFVEGECAGGGSEINSGFYHRTPDNILKDWRQTFGIKNLSTEELQKHFEIIEKDISVSLIPKKEEIAPASLKLKEGAEKLGWESMEVPRWFRFDKFGVGTKQSMTETYLKWYKEAGGKVTYNLKALKIKHLNDLWNVTCFDKKNQKKIIFKAKYLFLCGGAINTPFLLKLSGINRNAGRTLQMHPTVKGVAEFKEIINSQDMGVPVHQVKEFSPKISFGCSISSQPHLALAMIDNKSYIDKVNTNWRKMAIYYAMIKPIGVGKILKVPFFQDPMIKYNLTTQDLELLSVGLKKLCEILLSAGAINIWPSIKNYGPIKSMQDLEHIPKVLPRKKTNLMTIHLFSSCRMGENEELCITNSYGKVFKSKNLYINDGSLLPSAPGVNPQGTIMAIARRNIHYFLKSK